MHYRRDIHMHLLSVLVTYRMNQKEETVLQEIYECSKVHWILSLQQLCDNTK